MLIRTMAVPTWCICRLLWLLPPLVPHFRFRILADRVELSPEFVQVAARENASRLALLIVGRVVQHVPRKPVRIQGHDPLHVAGLDPAELYATAPVLDRARVQSVQTVELGIVRTDFCDLV